MYFLPLLSSLGLSVQGLAEVRSSLIVRLRSNILEYLCQFSIINTILDCNGNNMTL